jgi:hypothetical protein
MFSGALCEDGPGRAEALRTAFPNALRRRFTRADTPDYAGSENWCPASGLLVVTQASDYTLGWKVFDSNLPEPDERQFFNEIHPLLPALSASGPILSLFVDCFGGTCCVDVRTYDAGRCTRDESFLPNAYNDALIGGGKLINCDLSPGGRFPILARGAFHRLGQPF